MVDPADWINEHRIREVECLLPDINGLLRGKVLPVSKFLKAMEDGTLYLPTSALLVCADGRYSGSVDEGFAYADPDMRLVPDMSTICLAPNSNPARAFVFVDAYYPGDQPWNVAPRTC